MKGVLKLICSLYDFNKTINSLHNRQKSCQLLHSVNHSTFSNIIDLRVKLTISLFFHFWNVTHLKLYRSRKVSNGTNYFFSFQYEILDKMFSKFQKIWKHKYREEINQLTRNWSFSLIFVNILFDRSKTIKTCRFQARSPFSENEATSYIYPHSSEPTCNIVV